MNGQLARRVVLVSLVCAVSTIGVVRAQDEGIGWQAGPIVGQLGNVAQIQVPAGYRFAGKEGVRKFMELTQNPIGGSELGVIAPLEDGNWFVVFEFNDVGYVKDDEKNSLDANAILNSIKTGTEESNEIRKQRGWPTLDILGWQTAPRYDTVTNNLTWAILATSEGDQVVNHSVRLLGRGGVMKADLVLDPGDVAMAMPNFDKLLTGFEFTSGNKYAEFRSGDKIAQYGLTALVAGGVGAAVAKSGLFGKLWKVIVLGVVGALAALKRVLGSLFGKGDTEAQPQTPAQ